MPDDALGMVELGPLPADGYDWYLVRYSFLNDSGVTEGASGWVASGPADSPWLRPTDEDGWCCPFSAGASGTGSGVVGPVEIGEGHGLRWALVGGEDCPLVITINDVEIVSTRVHLFYQSEVFLFRDYPELAGTVDIEVQTDCAWTLSHGMYQG
jgi:hypothetical protein